MDATTPPLAPREPLPSSKRRKRKELVLMATSCEERKFADYREAIYPLLSSFGHFDSIPVEYTGENETHAS